VSLDAGDATKEEVRMKVKPIPRIKQMRHTEHNLTGMDIIDRALRLHLTPERIIQNVQDPSKLREAITAQIRIDMSRAGLRFGK
jgi:hypothetical protein